MKTAIKVENLSKAYQLGQFSTGTLSQDLKRWWAIKRGMEDPFLRIGETNDRAIKGESNIVWSLKDINFEIEKGDAVGVVGRNGAGKSTLLKLLSQITSPTTGSIKVNGRIASLLEVGTGFHPELSGRENIFLNGAILGMSKREITSKFDEIVDFSGVERFIDTPVKRYSSGMYVRLAFAVAAHLESEILIVDEVLAVGDAEFQKKCLGKMNEVSSGQGRTVLFVSHNMGSIKALCKKSIILNKGTLHAIGGTEEIIQQYLAEGISHVTLKEWKENEYPYGSGVYLKRAAIYPEGKNFTDVITTKDALIVEFDFINTIEKGNLDVTVDMFDSNGVHVTHFGMVCDPLNGLNKGVFRTRGIIPGNLLNTNRYIFQLTIGLNQRQVLLKIEDVLIVDIEDSIKTKGNNFSKLPGIIHPIIDWSTVELELGR